MSGPMRQRAEDQANAHRAKTYGVQRITLDPMTVEIPEPLDRWKPEAAALYRSIVNGPMTRYFAGSDFMLAWMLADEYDHHVRQDRRSPERLRAILTGLNSLGVDERARRGMGIELEQAEDGGGMRELLAELDDLDALEGGDDEEGER